MDTIAQWLHRPFPLFFVGVLMVLALLLGVSRARLLRCGHQERWRRVRVQIPYGVVMVMAVSTPGLFHKYDIWLYLWGIAILGITFFGYRLSLRSFVASERTAAQRETASSPPANSHQP